MKRSFFLVCLALVASFSSHAQMDFREPIVLDEYWSANPPLSADFDGDGKADLLSYTQNKAVVMYNNGPGDFTHTTILISNGNTDLVMTIDVGDLNGDGKADFAAFVSAIATHLSLFVSEGRSFHETQITFNDGPTPLMKSIQIDDLDKDGHPDIIGVNDGGSLYIVKGGPEGYVVHRLEGFGVLRLFDIADLNDDEINDIVAVDYDGEVEIHLGGPSGTFTHDSFVLNAQALSLAVADFSGDNIPDIATVIYNFSTAGYQTIIHANDGAGNFSPDTPVSTTIRRSLAVLDYNGDEKNDIIGLSTQAAPQITVLRNDGDGDFTSVNLFENPAQRAAGVSTGDFDGDGDLEILSVPEGQAIFVKDFVNSEFIDIAHEVFGLNAKRLIRADMNQDGFGDFVVGNEYTASLTILYGDSDHSYSTRKSFTLPFALRDLAVDDFNSDTYPDIGYTCMEQGAPNETVVLLSIPTGGYNSTVLDDIGYNTASAIDFDVDGKVDLVFQDAVFISDGSGNFTKTTITIPMTPYRQIMADFDNDGFPDVIVDNIDEQKIAFNDGNGQFTSFTGLLAAPFPAGSITAAHVNDDQLLDILIKSNGFDENGRSKLNILINNGNRQFTITEFDAFFGNDASVIDIDQDGRGELVTVMLGKAVIYSQDANGHFSPDGFTIEGDRFIFGNTGVDDLNGDGKPDLYTSYLDGSLVLAFNDFVSEPTAQPTMLTATERTDVTATTTMQKGDGTGRLLLIRANSDSDAAPVDGVFYEGNGGAEAGDIIGTADHVVMSSDATSVEITGLQEGNEYTVVAFEYSTNSDNTIINYNVTNPATLTFTAKATQTIAFVGLLDETFNNSPIEIEVSAGSGLPVSLTLVSGPATLSGNNLTATSPGRMVLRGTQAGDDNYMPAPDKEFSFCVYPPVPTVTVAIVSGLPQLTSSASENNQWQLDGVDVTGATNAVLVPELDGVYTVEVDYSGCARTSAETPHIFTEVLKEEQIQVFPNPATSRLMITLPGTNGVTGLSFMDMQGRQLSPVVTIHGNSAEVDLEGLAEGMYLVRVTYESGTVQSKVLVMSEL